MLSSIPVERMDTADMVRQLSDHSIPFPQDAAAASDHDSFKPPLSLYAAYQSIIVRRYFRRRQNQFRFYRAMH